MRVVRMTCLQIESKGTESRAVKVFASTSSILEDGGASQYSRLEKPHTCSTKLSSEWNFCKNKTSKPAPAQWVVRRQGKLRKLLE